MAKQVLVNDCLMGMNKRSILKRIPSQGKLVFFFFFFSDFVSCMKLVCVFFMMCVCSGPRAPGAAVGGGVCAGRCPGQSAEAAAAEHRPAATHFSAGQTDPGARAQSCWPVNI